MGPLNSPPPPPLSPECLLLWVFSQERDDIELHTSPLPPKGDLKYSSILCVTPAEITERCPEQHKSEGGGRAALQSGLHQRSETSGRLLNHLPSAMVLPFPGQLSHYPGDPTQSQENLQGGRRRRKEKRGLEKRRWKKSSENRKLTASTYQM